MVRTGLCVSDVTFREATEVKVETLVDVSYVLLEVCSNLWELVVSDIIAVYTG
jgi:hypothetical protein